MHPAHSEQNWLDLVISSHTLWMKVQIPNCGVQNPVWSGLWLPSQTHLISVFHSVSSIGFLNYSKLFQASEPMYWLVPLLFRGFIPNLISQTLKDSDQMQYLQKAFHFSVYIKFPSVLQPCLDQYPQCTVCQYKYALVYTVFMKSLLYAYLYIYLKYIFRPEDISWKLHSTFGYPSWKDQLKSLNATSTQ